MARSGKAFAIWVCCLFGLAACISTPKQYLPKVMPEQVLKNKLKQQLAHLASNETARVQLNQAMKFRTLVCQRCHGTDGHSRNGRCPNLAGQDPLYLVQQLQHFSDGRRHDFQMQSVAKNISDDDKVAVAIYFSSMPPRPSAEGTTDQSIKGEAIFKKRCAFCHGAQGQGLYRYPRLAGQLPGYISLMLHEFQKPNSRRRISIMRGIAAPLSKEDIKALAAYISRMK